MKKIYLLTLAVVLSAGAWAQRSVSTNAANAVMTKSSDEVVISNSTSVRAPFDVLWSEDFGTTTIGAIPATWTEAGADLGWKKTMIGSTGCFGTSTATLNSTTKLNGVLIYDADSINEALTGDCTGATYAQRTAEVVSGVINLTGEPNVRLTFQQYFRLCCSPTTTFLTVSVSPDGGGTWVDYDVKGTTGINSYNTNPELVSINISAAVGGSSNVKVKFTFDSGLGVYFWQIDDIQIIEGPANDVKLERAYADFSYTDGGYYTQTPAGQVAPITFRGAILNDGGIAQTTVNMNVSVTGAGTYSQNSNTITSMPLFARDTLLITTPTFDPLAVGTYNIVYTVDQVETDELIANNSITQVIKVSDTVYARDNGVIGAGISSSLSPSDYVGGDVDGSVIGTLYEFPAAGTITTASAFVATSTQNGASFDFVLYNIDGTGAFVEVANSDIYVVAGTADKNKWVTMPFITPGGPYPVLAGETYIIGVRVYGAPAFDLDILNDVLLEGTQPAQTTFVDAGGTGAWGWIQKAPFLHLNLEILNLGLNEIDAANAVLHQNIPNPAVGNTAVNFEIVKANEVSLALYDVTGKLIKSINAGRLAAGMHTVSVETADVDAGVYFYTLTVGEQKLTKKMTIMK